MRLDHVSYATTHDQISDVVQRIGSQIGTAFVDGGIHPRFGTRNFTAPLVGGQYIEVVCALDHPAAEQTPFGRAVSKKANEGGGWLTWVLSTRDITSVETHLGRTAIEGHRRRPDGIDLRWKQIGVNDILENEQLPFFIEWLSAEHPSTEGHAKAAIVELNFKGDQDLIHDWLNIGSDVNLENAAYTFEAANEDDVRGIDTVVFEVAGARVSIN